MTTEKKIPKELERRIKSCPVDFKKVANLINRARKDLRSAELLKQQDLEAAYTLLYDCMLHVALAYMPVLGVRPDISGKHKTIIEYVRHALDEKYENQIQFYDRMRRKRHQLIYEPGPYTCTEKEFLESEKVTKEFLAIISNKVKEQDPQKELSF